MKLTVKITKDILRESMHCDGEWRLSESNFKNKTGIFFNCAISKAVRDILPNAWTQQRVIKIYNTYEQISTVSPALCIPLPPEATDFIADFDHNSPEDRLKMPEMSFEIDVPDALIERIGIPEVERILAESKTLESIKS